MTNQQKGIITLIQSAISGEPLPLPKSFSLKEAYPVIFRHQIMTLAYEGAVLCGIPKTTPEMHQLFTAYCQCLLHSERQMQMIKILFSDFDAAGIQYLPLKGCNIKALYPKPELRLMGDADILIRTEQYGAICSILEKMGFQPQVESDHEYVWHSSSLHLELHKRLISSYNKDYFRYFGDGWKLAKPCEKCRHTMTAEDEFIYIFCHFAKHYRDGGIGCRHVTDLWVYLRAHPSMDSAYLERELKKLHLFTFYQNMKRLISFWFEDGPVDDVVEFLTAFLFKSGVWGEKATHETAAGAKSASAAGSIKMGMFFQMIHMLFPPLYVMRQKYPILQKCVILLPFIWIGRWLTGLLFRQENIRKQLHQLQASSPQQISAHQEALRYVGLDYYFNERI